MNSKKETKKHIKTVQKNIMFCINDLILKYRDHDSSKLESPELEYFNKYTPLLKESTYGSDEYFTLLKKMQPGLDHHYENNSHHPEYHKDGVNSMNLIQILEMVVDWYAASQRHENGDIRKSIEFNKTRFNVSDQLCEIFENTADFLDNLNKG